MKFVARKPRLGMMLSALSCVALMACSTPEKKQDAPPVTEPKAADAKPAVANDKPVELTLKMDAISAKEGTIELKPGGTLKSGDRMAISYSVDQPAYVYIAMAPAAGQAAILHPKSGDELVQPGQTLRFPSAADKWIKMDDSTGVENFFVYASKTPLPPAELINMVNADAAAAKKKAASKAPSKPKSSKPSSGSGSAPVLTADSRGIEIEGEEPETQPTSVSSGGIVRRQFSVNHK